MSWSRVAELEELDTLGRHAPPQAASHAHICVACRERRSLFRYRGAVRADRDHTLCFRCYRALCDSMRARLVARAA
jgi:hypothetical protein